MFFFFETINAVIDFSNNFAHELSSGNCLFKHFPIYPIANNAGKIWNTISNKMAKWLPKMSDVFLMDH